MGAPAGLAFYDLDGTLVSSNVVTQYAWYARKLESRAAVAARLAKLLVSAPLLIGLELYSRRRFNEVFYRSYGGMRREWLEQMAEGLYAEVFERALYPGAEDLVGADHAAGYRTVLVTGSLDFALAPLVRRLGLDDVIANRLVFEDGVATGEMMPPVLAGREKVEAMMRMCRQYNVEAAESKAYSDSVSDVPMLEAVGTPVATNPGRRLRRIAAERGWRILRLR